jgi:DNA-binding transcriptional MerR regulator
MADNKKTYLTIGALVRKFKKYYPDLTTSKLRFFETKGLVVPQRSGNKYRMYFKSDVKKINLILLMQRDYFLPLEVIKEKIDSIDFSNLDIEKEKVALEDLQSKLEEGEKSLKIKKLTCDEIREKYRLSPEYLSELIEMGIISVYEDDGKIFADGRDIEIIRIISELSRFGIQAKHLKLIENSAYRTSSFLQQIIYPLIMSSGKDSHRKAARTMYRLEEYFIELQEILFKKENKKFLDKHR